MVLKLSKLFINSLSNQINSKISRSWLSELTMESQQKVVLEPAPIALFIYGLRMVITPPEEIMTHV